MVETLFSDLFLKTQNWAYFWIKSLKYYTVSNLCYYYFVSFRLTTVVIITQMFLQNEIKTVYKIVKYKANYLYSIGDYTVIDWIIEHVYMRPETRLLWDFTSG